MNKYDELIKSLMEDKLYLPVLKMFAEYRFQTHLFQSLIRLTEQESMLKRHHRPYLHMREKIDTLCSFAKEVFDMNASEREEKLPELKDVIDNYIDMLIILEIMEKLFSEPECCQMEVWELDFLEEMNRKYHIGEKYD